MNVKHLLIAILGVAMVREISQADSPAPPRACVTADLVDDTSKVIVSTSHYSWLARDKEPFEPKAKPDPEATLKLDWKNVFHLKTIDGVIYKFDATTGDIKEKKKP